MLMNSRTIYDHSQILRMVYTCTVLIVSLQQGNSCYTCTPEMYVGDCSIRVSQSLHPFFMIGGLHTRAIHLGEVTEFDVAQVSN